MVRAALNLEARNTVGESDLGEQADIREVRQYAIRRRAIQERVDCRQVLPDVICAEMIAAGIVEHGEHGDALWRHTQAGAAKRFPRSVALHIY